MLSCSGEYKTDIAESDSHVQNVGSIITIIYMEKNGANNLLGGVQHAHESWYRYEYIYSKLQEKRKH